MDHVAVSNNHFPADLFAAKKIFYDPFGYSFCDFIPGTESQDYSACTFKLNGRSVAYRASRITPTKTGQFVTLWKRNAAGLTEPHEDSDPFDLYVVSITKDNRIGQFIFTKQALIENRILSAKNREGKRGFRVYPPWDPAENKQAKKTQLWQLEFFMEINDRATLDLKRADFLYLSR